ncbi:helix-turn-helix domain-containing protein [Saccharothrix yanglingensis]|uniref:DUF5753 domain-containing protein n=1 Tax=Saccharothrix yanglingensis TaxID=659496 RepID=A0ABU0WWA4_9PSEU|nr:helix-turn-helix transcriptional regulator [Saccharothrix yanglingensis]MDQ2584052.1 hypothetical protein [Saccharothrix yanglingensis]
MDTDEKTTPPRLSTARSRELGEELRRIRHRARLSSAVVAESLGWSLGKLSKLETGTRSTSPWEIATLIGRCAAAITTYEPLTVPALAQTRTYARALIGAEDLADARIARQEVLRPDGGPTTVFYIHDAALRLVVGDRAVMRDQLLHLTLPAGQPNVTAHVIPLTAPAHPALLHHTTLLTFDPPTRPLAYSENGTTTVFHDNLAEVEHCRRRMRELHARALPAAQSREVVAHWADAYDKRTR